ncbi:MAG: ABC transporter permease [Clostridiales bacterium]|nr:ABC transporter permease [Clostridiales bacterium]
MLFRMIRGALVRQWSKMLLIALTIALGASLATSMINVMLDVGDKVNEELKAYGANIVVKPNDSSLLTDIYDVEDEKDDALATAWLREDEIGNLKAIFWAFNIRDFAPFVTVNASLSTGGEAQVVGTWFNHHLSLPTGEELDAGVRGLRTWWDVTEGAWTDEQAEGGGAQVMIGRALAEAQGLHAGDTLTVTGHEGAFTATVAGVFDSGDDADEQLWAPLDAVQALAGLDGKVASIEVSAITTPDNELARRAAQNPKALSRSDYDTWYCTAYVSAVCYQITEAISGSVASAVRQVAESEGAILDKTQLLMILITALSLVGAALGISNLVTASVMERSHEIGLLKAIGAHDKAITATVMAEILITAIFGMIAGYFLGMGFAQFIGRQVFGASIEMKPMVIPLVAGLISLVTIAGSLPAIRMILRLDPAEVLHGSRA